MCLVLIVVDDIDFLYFKKLLLSDKPFVVRFGIVAMMKYFIDEKFLEKTIHALNEIKISDYYIDMAIAWLISEIIVKNPQNALENMQKILKINHFNKFVINKAIQKSNESYRIDTKIKEKIRELKVK